MKPAKDSKGELGLGKAIVNWLANFICVLLISTTAGGLSFMVLALSEKKDFSTGVWLFWTGTDSVWPVCAFINAILFWMAWITECEDAKRWRASIPVTTVAAILMGALYARLLWVLRTFH